ncbi:MAG: bacterial Ig-like domain-containing protein [Velocimicrobium sp.]
MVRNIVICAEEFTFNADGSIDSIPETASGISGTTTQILSNEKLILSHANFINFGVDSAYPYNDIKVSFDNNTDQADSDKCTFSLGIDPTDASPYSISESTANTNYLIGESIDLSDLKVIATYFNGTTKEITTYTTNMSLIDMSIAGSKTLTITYTQEGTTRTFDIVITVKKSIVNNVIAAEYDMSYDETKLKDISGNGNDAKLNGTYSFSDNALVLGGDGYVELPLAISQTLTDTENFTIRSKFTKASDVGVSWLFNIGSIASSSGANYLFFCPDCYSGIYRNTGSIHWWCCSLVP